MIGIQVRSTVVLQHVLVDPTSSTVLLEAHMYATGRGYLTNLIDDDDQFFKKQYFNSLRVGMAFCKAVLLCSREV